MAILPILKAPNKILKQKAESVGDVNNEIRKLLDDMLETMYHDRGIGLAAPQIGKSLRIFVLDLGDNHDTEDKVNYPIYLVNPKLTNFSNNMVTAVEGCLSVPGIPIDVERPDEVIVEYLDYYGKEQKLHAKGWLARAIQHENDHLDGKILLDYLSPVKRMLALEKLRKKAS